MAVRFESDCDTKPVSDSWPIHHGRRPTIAGVAQLESRPLVSPLRLERGDPGQLRVERSAPRPFAPIRGSPFFPQKRSHWAPRMPSHISHHPHRCVGRVTDHCTPNSDVHGKCSLSIAATNLHRTAMTFSFWPAAVVPKSNAHRTLSDPPQPMAVTSPSASCHFSAGTRRPSRRFRPKHEMDSHGRRAHYSS